jgi:haloacetate dehalogenase
MGTNILAARMDELRDLERVVVDTGETSIFARRGGAGPPVLLLHGFPQTHLMWRKVAPLLSRRFTVVCPDLRGYGQSGCPPSAPDHAPYAKRAMARDMAALMAHLGFPTFSVAGHDRGGRVAYRLALDHPTAIQRMAVLDVIPIVEAWDRADARLATAFWPWSLLAQPEPLPERLLIAAPEAVVDHALGGGWGSPPLAFGPDVRDAYIRALRSRDSVHAICEEFRAAAAIDAQHDADDRRAGRRITSPTLVLWSETGPLGSWYADAGGPLGIWSQWATDVRGRGLAAGHFFPEEIPDETAAALATFFAGES